MSDFQFEFTAHQKIPFFEYLKDANHTLENVQAEGIEIKDSRHLMTESSRFSQMTISSNSELSIDSRNSEWIQSSFDHLNLRARFLNSKLSYSQFRDLKTNQIEIKDSTISDCDFRNSIFKKSQVIKSHLKSSEFSYSEFHLCMIDASQELFKNNQWSSSLFQNCVIENANFLEFDGFDLIEFNECVFINPQLNSNQNKFLSQKNLIVRKHDALTTPTQIQTKTKNTSKKSNKSPSSGLSAKHEGSPTTKTDDQGRFGMIERISPESNTPEVNA